MSTISVAFRPTVRTSTNTSPRSKPTTRSGLWWFDKFSGAKAAAGVIVIPGLVNGGANYGASIRVEDGREEMYAILGVSQVDSDKQPVFDKKYLPNLVHEFTHSYVNPLV